MNIIIIIFIIFISVYFFLHTYRVTAFFPSINSLYLVYVFIFHHSRMLLVLILISGNDLSKL